MPSPASSACWGWWPDLSPPLDRLLKAVGKAELRQPAGRAQLRVIHDDVHRVTRRVKPGAKLDEFRFADDLANRLGDLTNGDRLARAYVDRARQLAFCHGTHGAGDIFDVQEITHLFAGRQLARLISQKRIDDVRHQPPRVLARAVLVEEP